MKLKELRIERGLTQAQLAKRMNVAQSTLAGWEIGTRKPDILRAKVLAAVLGVTIDELLSEDNNA